ncbi:Cyclic nucleotide-binding domain-containing protein 1 [Holothuria leucospilota]|uniref:Cyclic nucleotide-binding domain-containing protein 1 n=1 Tax=Holothuria leucospilota TaxID=206669 RepID=A0A9Q1C9J1_HOLLE|nr:Cyclic nucleotide-binding domain-containing protein 1 [Holothuria leucospilota]
MESGEEESIRQGREVKLWSERNRQETTHTFHKDAQTPAPIIDYAKLNWLCSQEGLRKKLNGLSTEEAHSFFMNHYHEIFVDNRPQATIPLTAKDLEAVKPSEDKEDEFSTTECSKSHMTPEEHPQNMNHDIKFHMAKLHKERKIMDPDILFANKIKELRTLIKKMPYERTADDITKLFTHLKTFDDLSKQVSKKELRELCTVAQQDIWRDENYTVFANTGFYIILRGSVTPATRPWLKVRGQPHPSSIPSILTTSPDDQSNEPLSETELSVGDCFGTLERVDGPEPNSRILCVETKSVPCEFLKIHSNDFKRITEHIIEHETSEKIDLIQACRAYKTWPRQSLQKLAELLEWTKFPENTVLVSEGFLCPFIVFIKTGECHVLREVKVNVTLPNGDKKWKRKQVVVGQMTSSQSFGEVSVLKSEPITSSVVTATQVEVGIITIERLQGLDETTSALLLQSNERLYKTMTEDQIHDEYIHQEQKRQWNEFKHGVVVDSINAKGIRPGMGKWSK